MKKRLDRFVVDDDEKKRRRRKKKKRERDEDEKDDDDDVEFKQQKEEDASTWMNAIKQFKTIEAEDLLNFNSVTGKELKVGYQCPSIWVSDEDVKGYKFKDPLGTGTCGTVYSAKSPKAVVAKEPNLDIVAIKVQMVEDEETFKKELDLTKFASSLDIGPNFIDSWISNDNVGFIVTEKWDDSLEGYRQRNPKMKYVQTFLLLKLKKMIDTLHETGLVHSDILEKNILVKFDKETGKLTDLVLTDFGLADMVKDWQDDQKFLRKLYNYHVSEGSHTKHYFKDRKITFYDVLNDPTLLDYSLLYYLVEENRAAKGMR